MVVSVAVFMLTAKATQTGVITIDAEEPGEIDTAEIDRLRGRLNEAAEAFADGRITAEQLATVSERLRGLIAAEETPPSISATRVLGTEEALAQWTEASLEGQRAFLRQAFDITIRPRGKGSRMPIEEQVQVRLKGSENDQ